MLISNDVLKSMRFVWFYPAFVIPYFDYSNFDHCIYDVGSGTAIVCEAGFIRGVVLKKKWVDASQLDVCNVTIAHKTYIMGHFTQRGVWTPSGLFLTRSDAQNMQ